MSGDAVLKYHLSCLTQKMISEQKFCHEIIKSLRTHIKLNVVKVCNWSVCQSHAVLAIFFLYCII